MRIIRDTSIESYNTGVRQILEPTQEAAVVEAVRLLRKATRRMVAAFINVENGTASARINKLIKDGVLEECGNMICPISNKNVKALKLREKQLDLIN